jgi:hypothetical protein
MLLTLRKTHYKISPCVSDRFTIDDDDDDDDNNNNNNNR